MRASCDLYLLLKNNGYWIMIVKVAVKVLASVSMKVDKVGQSAGVNGNVKIGAGGLLPMSSRCFDRYSSHSDLPVLIRLL